MSEVKKGGKVAVLLYSSIPITFAQDKHQSGVEQWFSTKNFNYVKIDGANKQNYTLRNKLWSISKYRAKYPQAFVQDGDTYTFKGLFQELNEAVDNGEFDDLFHGCIKD